jgi:hypothetical protein
VSNVEEARTNIEAVQDGPDEELLREADEIAEPVQGLMWVTGFASNH